MAQDALTQPIPDNTLVLHTEPDDISEFGTKTGQVFAGRVAGSPFNVGNYVAVTDPEHEDDQQYKGMEGRVVALLYDQGIGEYYPGDPLIRVQLFTRTEEPGPDGTHFANGPEWAFFSNELGREPNHAGMGDYPPAETLPDGIYVWDRRTPDADEGFMIDVWRGGVREEHFGVEPNTIKNAGVTWALSCLRDNPDYAALPQFSDVQRPCGMCRKPVLLKPQQISTADEWLYRCAECQAYDDAQPVSDPVEPTEPYDQCTHENLMDLAHHDALFPNGYHG